MKRRFFLTLVGASMLSACTEPLISEDISQDLKVSKVSVNASNAVLAGRKLSLERTRVEKDIRDQVFAQLGTLANGKRPVVVDIEVTNIGLVSPGQSALLGGSSTISGVATVKDAKTGEVIVPPTKVIGLSKNGWSPGGLLGAAIQAGTTPEKDYEATVAGFAIDVRRRMFGK